MMRPTNPIQMFGRLAAIALGVAALAAESGPSRAQQNLFSHPTARSEVTPGLVTPGLVNPGILPGPILRGLTVPMFIRGFVVAEVFPDTAILAPKRQETYLPGATMEQGSNAAVTSAITDLSGRFTFKTQVPGTYRICAKAEGFVDGCLDKQIELVDRSDYVGNLPLFPARGRLRTAGNSARIWIDQ